MYQFIGFPWQDLIESKQVVIEGRLGKGKSLLMSAISHYLFFNGYCAGVTANIVMAWSMPLSYRPEWSEDERGNQWCFCFDEIGKAFNSRSFKDVKKTEKVINSIINLRKRGTFLISPSALIPDINFRRYAIRVHRIEKKSKTNFLWVYHWEVGEVDKKAQDDSSDYSEGEFALINPRWIFNGYDTYDPPGVNRCLAFMDLLLER